MILVPLYIISDNDKLNISFQVYAVFSESIFDQRNRRFELNSPKPSKSIIYCRADTVYTFQPVYIFNGSQVQRDGFFRRSWKVRLPDDYCVRHRRDDAPDSVKELGVLFRSAALVRSSS